MKINDHMKRELKKIFRHNDYSLGLGHLYTNGSDEDIALL